MTHDETLPSIIYSEYYDCVECGQKGSVTLHGNRGTCLTPGCLYLDRVQFIHSPQWQKPKLSLAGREMWWQG